MIGVIQNHWDENQVDHDAKIYSDFTKKGKGIIKFQAKFKPRNIYCNIVLQDFVGNSMLKKKY
jgi:hypothetical protein